MFWDGGGGERKAKAQHPGSAGLGNQMVCLPCERFLQRAAGGEVVYGSVDYFVIAVFSCRGGLIPTKCWLTSWCYPALFASAQAHVTPAYSSEEVVSLALAFLMCVRATHDTRLGVL